MNITTLSTWESPRYVLLLAHSAGALNGECYGIIRVKDNHRLGTFETEADAKLALYGLGAVCIG